jgi:hypothetical protein
MNFDKALKPMNIPIQNAPQQMLIDRSKLYLPEQLENVNNLLKAAQGDVTFWGTRCIKKGESGAFVSLDDLAQWVVNSSQYAAAHCNDVSLKQRIAGVDLVKHVRQLLQQSDRQIQHANVVTRLFVCVRKKITRSHTPISHIVNGVASQEFRSFTAEKFLETFQGKFDQNDSHPCSETRLRSPSRIVATREAIEEPSELLRKMPPEIIGLMFSGVDDSLANTSKACTKFHAIAKAQLIFEFKALVREIIAKAQGLQLACLQKTTPQIDVQHVESSVSLTSSLSFTDFEAQIPSCFEKLSFQETKNAIRVLFLKLALRTKVFGDNALKLTPEHHHLSSYLTHTLRTLWNDTFHGIFENNFPIFFCLPKPGQGEGVCLGLLSRGDITEALRTDTVDDVPELLGAYRTYLLAHGRIDETIGLRAGKFLHHSMDSFLYELNELVSCYFMKGEFNEQKLIAVRKAIDRMDEDAGRPAALAFLIQNLLTKKKWKEVLQTCLALKDESIRTRAINRLQYRLLLANRPQETAEIVKLYSDKQMQLREIRVVLNGYLALGKIQEATQFATVFSDQIEIMCEISKLFFDRGFITQARDFVSKMSDSDSKNDAHIYTSKEGSDPTPVDQNDEFRKESLLTIFFVNMDGHPLRHQCSDIIFNAIFGKRSQAVILAKELPHNGLADTFLETLSLLLASIGEVDEALQIIKTIASENSRASTLLKMICYHPDFLKNVGGFQKIVDEISSVSNTIHISHELHLVGVFLRTAIHFGHAAEVVKVIQDIPYHWLLGDEIIPALLVHRQDLVTTELFLNFQFHGDMFYQILYPLFFAGEIDKAVQICEQYVQTKQLEGYMGRFYETCIDFLLTRNELKKAMELIERCPEENRNQLKKRFKFKFDPDSSTSSRQN